MRGLRLSMKPVAVHGVIISFGLWSEAVMQTVTRL